MKASLLFTVFLFLVYVSYSQITITAEETQKHIGDSVTVCGKVYDGRYMTQVKNNPTFLNIGGLFPKQLLTVVIWNNVRKQFETAPEELFKGKVICVTGRIELYKEKAQIVLRRKEDMRVKE